MSRRSLRTSTAIAGGRVAGWLSRVTGRGQGATISGRVINAMAPNALAQLAAGQRVALVSATNGKTTTTRLLAAAVARTGEPVVSNATGANLTSGIAPILAKARAPGLAVLEVDERVLPRVVDPLDAELLVLGNLSRDQLDRYGEVHAVGDLWRHAAETHPDLRVVANASDPHVVWAATPAKTTWVDLGLGWRNDAATCPNCAALLTWSTDRFDCPSCGFGQPATPNRLDGDTLVLDGTRVPLRLALPGRWNLANAALAVTAATTHFGVDPHEAADAATTITTVAGRYMTVALPDGRRARVLLAKNPAGWAEALPLAETKTVVLAIDSAAADGRDVSWLWDVEYEQLAGRTVIATGPRAQDLAVRLAYAEVECRCIPDLAAALAGHPEPVDVIATYTPFQRLRKMAGV